MAEEALSQAELEMLLRAAQSGAASGPSTPFKDASSPSATGVLSHDFKQPQRADRAQLRALASLHEAFARGFAGALSTLLRAKPAVKLAAVDELMYGEFHASLEDPGYFSVLRASPLSGQLLLIVDHAILFPILDRMLGGGREPSATVSRPLTQIELRLASRITTLIMDELSKAWQEVVELKLVVERVESSPHAVRFMPVDDVVIVGRFEVVLGEARGRMSLCVPAAALPPMGASHSSVARQGDGAEALVEIVAQLPETRIAARELDNLQVGDIIATDTDARTVVTVQVDGAPRYHGRPGAVQGHKAVQIEAHDHKS